MAKLRNLLLAHEARIQSNLRSLSTSAVHLTAMTDNLSSGNTGQMGQFSSQPNNEVHYSANVFGGSQSRVFPGSRQQQTTQRVTQQASSSNQPRSNSNRGRGNHRGCGRGRNYNNFSSNSSSQNDSQCQICNKWGHAALDCYHRFDIRYTATSQSQQHQALLAEPVAAPSTS